MQGTEKPDRGLLDALGLCGALVREGSVHRFLAEHRLRLFGDGLFVDLFGGRGRPSCNGSGIVSGFGVVDYAVSGWEHGAVKGVSDD